ncbi:MFS transporter, partial [Streptomyces anulatus]|nr:MFS transporter [Streptomyces anulatus]
GEFAATFRRAMPMCAGLLVVGAVIAWWTVRTPAAAAVRGERPECAVHCGVVAPPLEPERPSRARS